jgi:hypothetical protein
MRIEQLDNAALENARRSFIDNINQIIGENNNDYVRMWLEKLSLYELKQLYEDFQRINSNKNNHCTCF